MDWIEQLLGVSPDGGNGATERMCLVVLAVVVAALAWRRGLPALRARKIGR